MATVFFSWQSDKRNEVLKTYIIESCQELGFIFDEATRDESGSPDIVDTIKRKISNCDIFIADLTIIGKIGNKYYPNSNVIFELGYAHCCLDQSVIICLSDKPGNLPFDISKYRNSLIPKNKEDIKNWISASEKSILGELKNLLLTCRNLNNLEIKYHDSLEIESLSKTTKEGGNIKFSHINTKMMELLQNKKYSKYINIFGVDFNNMSSLPPCNAYNDIVISFKKKDF